MEILSLLALILGAFLLGFLLVTRGAPSGLREVVELLAGIVLVILGLYGLNVV